ncbi:response regulator [Paenibacillus sp. NPDC058071]|uniref:response regulator n=1 Tax=Paenibacillus sp. NPDC058071 TaxID=3346326 RepID=UPI0036DF0154
MTQHDYCKLLIVDDEVLIRQGIKHFIHWEQEGFQIVGEAANGKEALEQIAKLRPHIVLTDIVMPVMDGEELGRQIRQHYPEIEVIVLSSFGEFDYVRSSFQSGARDYILKPKLDMNHLLEVLKQTADHIPSLRRKEGNGARSLSLDNLFERLLTGFEAEIEGEELKKAFPFRCYCLIGASLANLEGWDKVDAPRLKQRITEQLKEKMKTHDIVVQLLPSESDRFIVLLNLEPSGLASLPHWSRELTVLLAEIADDIAVVAGEPFTGLLKECRSRRDELIQLMQYTFFLPGKRVILYNELPEPTEAPGPFHLNEFTEAFKRGRFDTAFNGLQQHIQALAADYRMDVFDYKSFLNNLIFNIVVLLSNMDFETKELDSKKYNYFRSIEESRYAIDAIATMDEFIGEARSAVAAKSAHAGNANMQRLLDYIDEHYADPLTLTEVAKHFHFNPSYLSSYFSSHNKEGFIEYLQRVRTDKASKLLREGEATISEIGGRVGYSDHSYFCKVFKKHTGLSPSRYRQQYLGNEKK